MTTNSNASSKLHLRRYSLNQDFSVVTINGDDIVLKNGVRLEVFGWTKEGVVTASALPRPSVEFHCPSSMIDVEIFEINKVDDLKIEQCDPMYGSTWMRHE
jgi:hypothetical protein